MLAVSEILGLAQHERRAALVGDCGVCVTCGRVVVATGLSGQRARPASFSPRGRHLFASRGVGVVAVGCPRPWGRARRKQGTRRW